MSLETFIIIVCVIYIAIYIPVFEINWQWVGFKKLKKLFRKKGRK